jgi:hypothetical protein
VSLWRPWSTLSVLTEPQSRHKVVLIADSNRASPSVALGLVIWSAGYTRDGGVGHLSRDVKRRPAALLLWGWCG